MKQSDLKYSCLIAVLYFGMNVNAQVTPQDTVAKEQKIEEVVLIGYGSQKKANVTGSIATISAKDLADKPNANPISSVQGKVAGVQILNSGTPGGSPRVDIRGISSLTGKTVFIVDGMITDDISFLSPQDIESMSILKDPSSLAIYGARASNGAVIIKTKTGRGKKPVFNFNSYLGIKTVTNVPDMVNSDQYIELYNEKLSNEGVTDPTKFLSRSNFPADTKWFKEILRNSIINSNDLSAAGTLGKLNYYLSVGFLQDEGNLAAGSGINSGSGFNRFNSKVNLSYKITKNLTIGDNFTFSKMRTDLAQNPLLDAYSSPPVYAPINPSTGNYQYFTLVNITNPRAKLDLFRSQTREERLLNNIWGEYKFLNDFTFRISYTSDNINTNQYEYTPVSTYVPNPGKSKLITRDSRTRNYVWDNTLSWKKDFGKHNLELLAGFSRTRNSYAQAYAEALNVYYNGDNSSLEIANGTDIYMTTYDKGSRNVIPYQDRIESFFGRLNYDYGGKYLINASIRRDGTSKYSENDRYRTFPAISAGWVISKENFMSDQNLFNLLKLRASWGKLGNPDVQRAYTLNTSIINAGAYYGNNGSPAQTIDQIIDPNIGWETTTGRDIGLEMALLNNKLKIEATYFDKDTKDVVYGIVQGTVSGATNWNNYITNAYSFNNRGFEASVNYDTKINENVRIGVYGNLTTLKNEITSVYGGSYLETGASLFGNSIIRLQEGQSVGSYYGYQVVGVFQNQAEVSGWATQNGAKPGGFKFADIDGNGIIDARDKTFLGSPVPKGTYGFGFNMNVYDFDFAIDFQGVFGNKIYNYNREQRFGNESWDLDFYNNRWHGAGTSNTYAMATNDQSIILPNSFYVEDGSYFRIRNIQIGYNLPKAFANSLSITRLRLYVSAQNPWTSFKYNGFSPEILNTDRVQMGIDNNIYPISAIYTFGMNLTF
ncbi:SusC/RagA family TonB-linked outer membrane protein [Chryseobacterium daecheongense]|uniref:SusC/RagA family TonB-linked outer membrane protein n=1 Tax=Chryseobacterium daecheongense TaxID=192389 RepID=A0A3N0W509_9FLAO|nr:SusC/RagA family TonB-linked outer membrane protein [Chryseobacterium daecheongense]ROI00138.1 SusC/RagA family TonB-linked outer membrane protein [Chryseobacterium daecheongense]TDX94911.1 TonB-linked SusC/RagA family outer membrane protein [Chryseobacterium daecheongense]